MMEEKILVRKGVEKRKHNLRDILETSEDAVSSIVDEDIHALLFDNSGHAVFGIRAGHVQLVPGAPEGLDLRVTFRRSNGIPGGGHDRVTCLESLSGNLKAEPRGSTGDEEGILGHCEESFGV